MVRACALPSDQYVDSAGDCDDSDPERSPDALEVCDDIDNDCDDLTDDEDDSVDPATGSPWYADSDGDTYGDAGAELWACTLPEGHVADDSDCDDTNSAVNPSAAEICNVTDDDCDGLLDDDDPSVDLSLIHI